MKRRRAREQRPKRSGGTCSGIWRWIWRTGRGIGGGGIRERRGGLEVEVSPWAVENESRTIVRTSGILSSGEGAEPFSCALAGFADLGNPLAPASLTDAAVLVLAVVWTSLSFSFPLGGLLHRWRCRRWRCWKWSWRWSGKRIWWSTGGEGNGVVLFWRAVLELPIWIGHWEREIERERVIGKEEGGMEGCFMCGEERRWSNIYIYIYICRKLNCEITSVSMLILTNSL